MASLAPLPSLTASPLERRLQAEWSLLNRLAVLNPDRLTAPSATDLTFRVALAATPALSLDSPPRILRHHCLRIVFPSFFPALPLEIYLTTPVFHPNVHPETGFVCLWDRHRIANTVELALHKTAALLGWQLFNFDPRHTMQTDATRLSPIDRRALADRLQALPLHGLQPAPLTPPPTLRRRLS